MPIYGYQCAACGHKKDVLQKLADPPLTECPVCNAASFSRQVSAPAFQLKGTGWYVTDFRDGNQGKKGKADEGKADEGKAEVVENGGDKAKPGSDAGKGDDARPAPATAKPAGDSPASPSVAGGKAAKSDSTAGKPVASVSGASPGTGASG